MDCYWLLTWTCYGHWLPGDQRGFVGKRRDENGNRVIHNLPGTPYDRGIPRLEAWVQSQMNGNPVQLERPDAEKMIAQFRETANIRHWELQAASVMFNHTHLVVDDESTPAHILATFKSWATRALNTIRERPENGSFWTAKGSKRRLPDEQAVRNAVFYVVKNQPNPLAIWYEPRWKDELCLDGLTQSDLHPTE